jgi:MOSC domain-containing protein YiiM
MRASLDCAAMPEGRVMSLHVASVAGARMAPLEWVRAVSGRGLEGDRYFLRAGTYSRKDGPDRQITLIETEALEALERDYAVKIDASESRRNVATRDVALNHLVGRTFRVGEATVRGLRLCEPCGHMERLCGKPVRPGLVHRGGLRAEILTDGTIRVGDPIGLL